MAIEVQKRPYKYNFSGNTIHYQLYSAIAAADPAIYIEVKIKFRHQPDAFEDVTTLPCYPTAGIVKINIQDIIDSKLEYETPNVPDVIPGITTAYRQTGFFYIEFREITNEQQDSTWDGSEADYVCGVMKGGMDYFRYRNNNYWINYWPANGVKKFLTWQQSGRLANIAEPMWLAYLNDIEEGVNALQVVAVAYYTDGTNAFANESFVGKQKAVIHYIPSGCMQWGLHLLNPDKKIYYWTIELRYLGVTISETFRYYADNRKFYNDITLHYRGSLGGLDSVRIRGVIEHAITYESVKQDRVFQPDYYNGDAIEPQQRIANNKELKAWKGDIGYLAKEEQDRMRDAQLQREVWWLRDKWWPVNAITSNIKQKLSTDTKWSMPYEWTLAHSGDHYYTPENVDVGDGFFTDNVCRAKPINLSVTVDTETDPVNAIVTIDFDEEDPQAASEEFKMKIEGYNWETFAYGALPIVKNLPKNQEYEIEFRSICAGEILGKKVSEIIDTTEGVEPPPPPPVDNVVSIMNNSNYAAHYNVSTNNNTYAVGVVGAHNTKTLGEHEDTADATINVALIDYIASAVSIVSNGITYYGSIDPLGDGHEWEFEHVNIENGFTIIID